ncbi:MAG: response regulator [Deltaproteobacteria bacterium]|nr:response regulator [Deltaproteobacteria bacterium]
MSKILVIDDEASIRALLRVTLTHKGHEVILAENGKKGIEVFKEVRPSIVITDIKMPGMDGIEVLKRIKALDADVRVIVITGHGDMDSAVEALKLEASDFINKPITDDALTIAIKRSEEFLWLKQKLRQYTDNLESMVKEATEELQTAHDFQKNLIESSIDGIVAADKDGTVIVFNQAAESLLGYDADEVVEKMPMDEICSQDLYASIEDRLRSKEFRGENRLVNYDEAVVRSKYGEDIPVRLSGVRLSEGGVETGKVCFLQDLREIKRLQRELIENERVAATGQAVAGMAHYIKNVLNGLQGGVYMVNIGLNKDKPERLHKGWAVVQNNIGRISNLVMNMLTYSREREPDYEYCSPNEIAQEVFDLLEGKAEEDNIEFAKDFDVSLKEWFLDPRGIHRCLLNLVGNAFDACVLDPDENKARSVVIRTREEDGHVRFDVTDNGMGMNREVQSKLFGRFFSTKGGRGTGLGLLVTKKIVDEQGGNISFESESGKGTTFTMRFPNRPSDA